MTLAAPFPWFGGKSRAAADIWARFGDTPNYVEPFAGSLAVLLGRPASHRGRIETVNDLDAHLVNVWRAVAADPDAVAKHADWPVSEADLHARHVWLLQHQADLTARLCGDPRFYDAELAGWWIWGACAWIGSGWCSGKGPWWSVDGRLVNLGNAGRGINRQLPHLGDGGQGINRQLPHLGDGGRGVIEWFRRLAARLRQARITCGDWTRVVTDSVTTRHGTTAILLDPPYGGTVEQTRVYAHDDTGIATAVRAWAVANGDNPQLRIALCGYDGEGHDALEDLGWTVHAWKAHGGYGGGRNGIGDANSRRERIWFSPHCLGEEQPTLFAAIA